MTQLRRVRGVNRVGGVVGRFGPNGESGVWPVHALASDPYYDDVSLLLHMNGTDGSTTFTDSSKNVFTVTASGNAQIDDAQSKFGGAACLLDGTGDWLEIADNDAFEFGSQPFTLEAWIRVGITNRLQAIVGKDAIITGQPSTRGFQWRINSSPLGLQLITFSSNSTFSAPSHNFSFSTNTWYHVAVTRIGETIYQFVDGALIGTGSAVATIQNSTTALRVGALSLASPNDIPLQGHIDELRITKGRVRYTSAFNPPARAFLP